jgi:hypothetical protein
MVVAQRGAGVVELAPADDQEDNPGQSGDDPAAHEALAAGAERDQAANVEDGEDQPDGEPAERDDLADMIGELPAAAIFHRRSLRY